MAQAHSNRKVLVLAGDGIGPEIMRETARVMEFFDKRRIASFEVSEGLVGGSAYDADGVPLTAALYKPENFDPKKKYPMMVYIYERLTQNVNKFVDPRPSHNINISYYVSNGYLVLTPDIAYTTGFPGQSALKCVLPAVQEVVNRGFVNEQAIGIQGHSWAAIRSPTW